MKEREKNRGSSEILTLDPLSLLGVYLFVSRFGSFLHSLSTMLSSYLITSNLIAIYGEERKRKKSFNGFGATKGNKKQE